MSQISETDVLDALRPIVDPDFHRSIVDLGFVKDIEIDGGVLLFTFVVSFLTGIAFGVLPGMWINTDVLAALREGGNAQSTTGRTT